MDLRKIYLTLTVKWALYVLLAFTAYVLQTTPGLFQLFGIKPVLLVPVCVAVAALEGEYAGAFFGIFCGMLWDLAAGRIAGFFALFCAGCCFAVGLIFKAYLRQNRLNTILINGGVLTVLFMADFLFSYVLFDLQGVGQVLAFRMLPTMLYSALLAPIPFWIARRIHLKFTPEE